MKSTLHIAGALVGAAATLLLVPASANIDASQTNATLNAPKTAKAPSWQRVASSHRDGDGCTGQCGTTDCDTAANRSC